MSYIKRLQEKEENTRKQILVASLIASMSIVVFIWIYSLTDRFGNQTKITTEDSLKPFTLFANSISDTYQNISASLSKIPSEKSDNTKTPKQINLTPVESPTNQ